MSYRKVGIIDPDGILNGSNRNDRNRTAMTIAQNIVLVKSNHDDDFFAITASFLSVHFIYNSIYSIMHHGVMAQKTLQKQVPSLTRQIMRYRFASFCLSFY